MRRDGGKGVLGLRRIQRTTIAHAKADDRTRPSQFNLIDQAPETVGEEFNPLVHRAFWHGPAGKDSITQYTYFISGNTSNPPTAESPTGLRFNLGCLFQLPCLPMDYGWGQGGGAPQRKWEGSSAFQLLHTHGPGIGRSYR